MTVNGITGNNPLYGLTTPSTTTSGGAQSTTNQPPKADNRSTDFSTPGKTWLE